MHMRSFSNALPLRADACPTPSYADHGVKLLFHRGEIYDCRLLAARRSCYSKQLLQERPAEAISNPLSKDTENASSRTSVTASRQMAHIVLAMCT
jgi:hypothetical protein